MEQLAANAELRQRLVRIMRRREAILEAKLEDDIADGTEKWHYEKFEQGQIWSCRRY